MDRLSIYSSSHRFFTSCKCVHWGLPIFLLSLSLFSPMWLCAPCCAEADLNYCFGVKFVFNTSSFSKKGAKSMLSQHFIRNVDFYNWWPQRPLERAHLYYGFLSEFFGFVVNVDNGFGAGAWYISSGRWLAPPTTIATYFPKVIHDKK